MLNSTYVFYIMLQKVVKTANVPIKFWLRDIEEGALIQAQNIASLPFAYKHIALMPDAHQGYGMPIGGVLAADGVVVPNAVGVDIGCGMCALQTPLKQISRKSMEQWIQLVRQIIPTGHKHHKQAQEAQFMPRQSDLPPIVQREYENALTQLGTLGGGNHFIELQRDNNGFLWLMVHSGSRNIGKQVADHYNRVARKLNEQWNSPVPLKHNLAYLPLNTEEAKLYMDEMRFCVDFAKTNRTVMIKRAAEALMEVSGNTFEIGEMLNATHNYASLEIHYSKQVVVHRKGATSAKKGEVGIVPGSQGAPSFIVRGVGNSESFCSCSHGAGRRMGRRQAQRSLDLAKEQNHMNAQGIVHGLNATRDLDEAPGAYKDIEEVMQLQDDLVKVENRLQPIAVIKG